MKSDYSYCFTVNCIHRKGCKRWVGNYSDDEVNDMYMEGGSITVIDFTKCVPDSKDINCTNDYSLLDRFRSGNS